MQFLQQTHRNPRIDVQPQGWLSTAQELALEECLLRSVEAAPPPFETLKVWEASQTSVIVGRGSKLTEEVNLVACEKLNVPILRRCSGGCAVVVGPGCLMYSVVLDLRHRPQLRVIDRAHEFVLQKILQALKACGITDARQAGLSDLVIQTDCEVLRKFSGNSLRITRDALLYHGTILYGFPLESIAELLLLPPRQPAYRGQRGHSHFVTNLAIDPNEFTSALAEVWNAISKVGFLPNINVERLVTEKYADDRWNRRH